MNTFLINLETTIPDALFSIQRACREKGEKLPEGTPYPVPFLVESPNGTGEIEWHNVLAGIGGGGGG